MELLVAVVGPAHALRGEVALDLRTDSPQERFFEGAQFDTASHGVLTVESIRVHKGRMLVKFEEVQDRTGAEALRGVRLLIDADDVLDEDDAWYPHELTGLKVRTVEGEPRGVVSLCARSCAGPAGGGLRWPRGFGAICEADRA